MKKLLLVLAVLVVVAASCSNSDVRNEKPNVEDVEPTTEINLQNNGLVVKISPTNGQSVSGVVTVTLERVPEKASKVLVSMTPQGFSGDLYNDPNVIIEWVDSPSDGQNVLLDTSKLENGVYGIGVAATYEGAPEASPWIALVQSQVSVENGLQE